MLVHTHLTQQILQCLHISQVCLALGADRNFPSHAADPAVSAHFTGVFSPLGQMVTCITEACRNSSICCVGCVQSAVFAAMGACTI